MYQCMFTSVGCAYSTNYYDLPTDDKEEITQIIKNQGFDVLEVYDIKEQ